MRLISAIITTALVIMPAQAFACSNHGAHHAKQCQVHHHHALKTISVTPNSMSIAREAGVMVYRGSSAKPNYAAASLVQAQKRADEALAKAQARERRLEARRVDERLSRIDDRLDDIQSAQRAAPRRNRYGYGRSYRGNNRFFGRNGFAGNSNFSGASVALLRPRRARRSKSKH